MDVDSGARPPRPRAFRRLAGRTAVGSSIVVLLVFGGLWARSERAIDEVWRYREWLEPSQGQGGVSPAQDNLRVASGRGIVALYRHRQVFIAVHPVEDWPEFMRDPDPSARYNWQADRDPAVLDNLLPGGPGIFRTLRWTYQPELALGVNQSDLVVALPYWLLMVPFAVPPIWWLWCPPGRPWPRLTLRRLMVTVAASAAVASGLVSLGNHALIGRVYAGFTLRSDPGPTGDAARGAAIDLGVEGGNDDLRKLLATTPRGSWLRGLTLHSSKVDDAGLEMVGRCRELELLDLSECPITARGLAQLEGLGKLRTLYLSGTKVDDAALDSVAKLTTLEHLSLTYEPIGDDGLRRLAGLTAMRTLDLTECRITDAGLQHLGGMVGLTSLTMDRTGVTEAVWDTLGRTIPWAAARSAEIDARTDDGALASASIRATSDLQRRAFAALLRARDQGATLRTMLEHLRPLTPNDALDTAMAFRHRWPDLYYLSDRRILTVSGESAELGDDSARIRLVREGGRWKVDLTRWDDRTAAEILATAPPLATALEQIRPEIYAGKYENDDPRLRRAFAEKARAAGLPDKGGRAARPPTP